MAVTNAVLGIDFGTTNTAAAWCDEEGRIHLVPVNGKGYVLPSIVWYGGRDRVLVGQLARQQVIDDPLHTVFGAKRFMGRRFRSEFVSRNKDRYVFPIVEDDTGGTAVEIFGEATSFTEIAFHVIRRIVELAGAAAEAEFEQVVLTVPAHFGFGQRRAVRTAAEMAGLEVRALVNEPTAAALYYAKHRDVGGEVLVFDLGGGTFDATLLSISRREVRVLATGGDAYLGGADFDAAVVEQLVDRFAVEHGVDLRSRKVVMQRLSFAVEAAKIALSRETEARVKVPFVAQKGASFVDLEYRITRPELEELCDGLLARLGGIVDDTLHAAGATDRDVDEIVLVGGQTRMPAVQTRFGRRFRHDPGKHIHPELGVAIGAAILGRTLNLARGPALEDVVQMPIGVMAPSVGTRTIIGPNTPVPRTERVLLEGRPPEGEPLVLAVYESLTETSVERELLGTVRVDAAWLAAHPGRLELEVRMGQDFDLTFAVVGPGGGQALKLEPAARG